jgi:Spy/CpxP family protein refolding chaperone
MTRLPAFVMALLLAGCASSMRTAPSAGTSGSPGSADQEVHRGLLTNQKSSPDSGQSPGGDGRGGGNP